MSGIFEGKNLLSAEKTAEVLGVKPSTIKKWVHEKKIPFVKFGDGKKSIVMFNPKRLNQWVEELSHEHESENEKQKRHEKPKKSNRKVLEQFNDAVANILLYSGFQFFFNFFVEKNQFLHILGPPGNRGIFAKRRQQ
jgi:excisionase family DNA binding protein